MKKRNKTISSIDYVPSFQDLGMNEDDYNAMSIEREVDFAAMVDHWIERNNARISKLKEDRNRIALLKYSCHWYNMVNKNDIHEAIEKTRILADGILQPIIDRQTNVNFYRYYSDLLHRVNHGMFTITKIKPTALKSLPNYDPSSKEIFGSKTSMVRLWCHVFSLRK